MVVSREYSFDFEQDGFQIPAKYTFTGPAYIVEVLETYVLRLKIPSSENLCLFLTQGTQNHIYGKKEPQKNILIVKNI